MLHWVQVFGGYLLAALVINGAIIALVYLADWILNRKE